METYELYTREKYEHNIVLLGRELRDKFFV